MSGLMNLVPITELKIDKTKWLNTKIKYESSLNIEDLLNDMCENILNWLYNLEDYTIITDEESFKRQFKNMIYEKYLYNSKSEIIDTELYDYNYFELKYLEEINSLYLESKRILDHYGLDFFKDKDFMELFYFIYEYTQYLEGQEDSDDSEEEDYLNYNIDAEKIK
tara:strand:- start:122 stop:619 length:498 start_codon:yes stop_codon:yes gene_type:complete